jgi:hypothetical protein
LVSPEEVAVDEPVVFAGVFALFVATADATDGAPEETPSEASATPLEIVAVVTQLEELGIVATAVGVTVSPTVYGVGWPSFPV